MTSPNDVLIIVDYLRTKPAGATLDDARATLDSRILDARKVSAYESWGFIARDGARLKLTEEGRRLARADASGRAVCFAHVVRSTRAYRLAAEWMFHQRLSTVTSVDLASHWYEHVEKDLGTDNETTMRYQVACFFQLAAAAGLGTYFIGRKGQQTRLEIDKNALGQFVAEAGLGVSDARGDSATATDGGAEPDSNGEAYAAGRHDVSPPEKQEEISECPSTRVFISHGKNVDIVDQVKTMLELADLDYEVAVEEETAAIPVPEKVFTAMRKCAAAVICVTADENTKREDGSSRVNDNVLIEIGAAFVLYDKRVVLVWDKRIEVPSNLQGLYRCEFEGDELSWSSGMRLMKAVNRLKRSA